MHSIIRSGAPGHETLSAEGYSAADFHFAYSSLAKLASITMAHSSFHASVLEVSLGPKDKIHGDGISAPRWIQTQPDPPASAPARPPHPLRPTAPHSTPPQANAAYAAGFGVKGSLALPPAKKAAFLVCMDARINPAAAFGLAEGDVHVIRKAGGGASDDAIRSLVISHKLLGTNEFFLVHHTDCGMEYFTDGVIGELLATSVASANIVVKDGVVGFENASNDGGAPDGRFINWLTIKNQAASIKDDAERIRGSPLVNKTIPIHGYVYDVKTGVLNHVLSI